MESDTSTLRMPDHNVGVLPCRGSTEPGYALMRPDGRLHCNRCGWTTPDSVITAYSPDTGKTYLTMEDLTSAEANGWVVVGTCTRPGTSPVVTGPYTSREAARQAQARLRRKWRKDEADWNINPGKVSTAVRPLWKDDRGQHG